MVGHTYKDCDQLRAEEERMGNIADSQMPFGEFLKASPMKMIHTVVNNGPEVRDEVRRSIFQRQMTNLENIKG